MSGIISPYPTGFLRVAATPQAGVALTNAPQTLLTWTAPSDGLNHRVSVFFDIEVTSNNTGGAATWVYTNPAGVVSSALTLVAGSASAGAHRATDGAIIESGSTVTISLAALSAGGPSTAWAEIWGI